jgi:hypothetical protein
MVRTVRPLGVRPEIPGEVHISRCFLRPGYPQKIYISRESAAGSMDATMDFTTIPLMPRRLSSFVAFISMNYLNVCSRSSLLIASRCCTNADSVVFADSGIAKPQQWLNAKYGQIFNSSLFVRASFISLLHLPISMILVRTNPTSSSSLQ